VNLIGNGGTVAVGAGCKVLNVSGSGNKVTTEATSTINLSGGTNNVRWKAVHGKPPKVNASGSDNDVAKAL
jgi:hypothetical protein